jgi:hypothetical protein
MNKLDSFNKDKTKCKRCKEYFDKTKAFGVWFSPATAIQQPLLCENCDIKWNQYQQVIILNAVPFEHPDHEYKSYTQIFEDWCNNEQQA